MRSCAGSKPGPSSRTLKDSQLRSNLGHATTAIRAKRGGVVAEVDDWEELRDEGAAARDRSLRRLDEMLVRLEESVTAAGGHVHWAADKAQAQRLVVDLVKGTGSDEVIKVKSLLTDELEPREEENSEEKKPGLGAALASVAGGGGGGGTAGATSACAVCFWARNISMAMWLE